MNKVKFDALLGEITNRVHRMEKWKVNSIRQWEAQARRMPSFHHSPHVLFKDDKYTVHDNFKGGVRVYEDELLVWGGEEPSQYLVMALKDVRRELDETPLPVEEKGFTNQEKLCELVFKLYCMADREEDYVGSTHNARAKKLYAEIVELVRGL